MTVEQQAEPRTITATDVRNALNLVVFHVGPGTVEAEDPACPYEVCKGERTCLFPRYSRNGVPVGLTARVLMQLGYPLQLLLDLDREHEMGDIFHPGVKIGRSSNAALRRITAAGLSLLSFIQEHQKLGISWGDICLLAFEPRWRPRILDSRKRPWVYDV